MDGWMDGRTDGQIDGDTKRLRFPLKNFLDINTFKNCLRHAANS
jgi:hypothetical protein